MSRDARMSWGWEDIEYKVAAPRRTRRSRESRRYSEDQPRDEHGRFGSGGDAATSLGEHLKAEGGATISPTTGQEPTGGFQVAIPGHAFAGKDGSLPTIEQFTDPANHEATVAAVDTWLQANAGVFDNPNVYVGGWVQDGRVYLEPSQNVATEAEAAQLGVDRGQADVWDVSGQREIVTGGTAARSHQTDEASERDDGRRAPRFRRNPRRRYQASNEADEVTTNIRLSEPISEDPSSAAQPEA